MFFSPSKFLDSPEYFRGPIHEHLLKIPWPNFFFLPEYCIDIVYCHHKVLVFACLSFCCMRSYWGLLPRFIILLRVIKWYSICHFTFIYYPHYFYKDTLPVINSLLSLTLKCNLNRKGRINVCLFHPLFASFQNSLLVL